jgi:hypothetical protein
MSPKTAKSKKAKAAKEAKAPKKANKAAKEAKAPKKTNAAAARLAAKQASSQQAEGPAGQALDGAIKKLTSLSTELKTTCDIARSILAELKEFIDRFLLPIILPPYDGTTVLNPPTTYTLERPLTIKLQFTDQNAYNTFQSAVVVFAEGLIPITWDNYAPGASNPQALQLSFTVVPSLMLLTGSSARTSGHGKHPATSGTGTGTVIYTSGSFGRSYAQPAFFPLTPTSTM